MKSICIAILGTDGSGKTTVIDALTGELEKNYGYKTDYSHLRPHWLPDLGVLKGQKKAPDAGVVTEPHALPPSGFLGSLFRLCYYTLDYTVGYWSVVRPKLKKPKQVIIFDRYCYDFLVDPRRMRIALPRWILTGMLRLVPEPDKVFCLGAEPEVIFERKPETSLEEVSRQIDELRALCSGNERAVWIDTGGTVAQSCHEVLDALNLSESVN
ncbi:MAG: hypothetical protein H7A51_11100 [Akkermansiaceae bacterium]|nr:hypothetical protein [Akkermansiaceae bacterium]